VRLYTFYWSRDDVVDGTLSALWGDIIREERSKAGAELARRRRKGNDSEMHW